MVLHRVLLQTTTQDTKLSSNKNARIERVLLSTMLPYIAHIPEDANNASIYFG